MAVLPCRKAARAAAERPGDAWKAGNIGDPCHSTPELALQAPPGCGVGLVSLMHRKYRLVDAQLAPAERRKRCMNASASAWTAGSSTKAVRCKETKTTLKLATRKASTVARSRRDIFPTVCARPSSPQARARSSKARVVSSESSKARTFVLKIGKINAFARALGIAWSTSRCFLSRCAGRFAWGWWQNSQALPLAHCPEAKYRHGREHSCGCPKLPWFAAGLPDTAGLPDSMVPLVEAVGEAVAMLHPTVAPSSFALPLRGFAVSKRC